MLFFESSCFSVIEMNVVMSEVITIQYTYVKWCKCVSRPLAFGTYSDLKFLSFDFYKCNFLCSVTVSVEIIFCGGRG